MSVHVQHHDAVRLLQAEHAVARALAETPGDHAGALAAIGEVLGFEDGALWLDDDGGPVRAAVWRRRELFERPELPRRVLASGEPAYDGSAVCFPVHGTAKVLGAIEFRAHGAPAPGPELIETMASIGTRLGLDLERRRGAKLLRASDARQAAILDAAFDCIVTIDAAGDVVEVNEAAERVFGYPASEMIGRELAELVIPPALREAHRRGVARHLETGESTMVGHPVELPAMRADGSEFIVEIAITRPDIPGPPQFTGFIRDITARRRDEEALRALATEQAALRRVATTVASEGEQERLFAQVTEEVGRLLGANSANTLRYEPDGTAVVVGAWSTGGVRCVPLGTREALDGPTGGALVLRTGQPARVATFEGMEGSTAQMLRDLGFRCAVGAPIKLAGRLWGSVLISSVEDDAFPDGAEQRVADFAELISLALANAQAREELASSRARIVEAGDAERRRIERNLHDGAQQRLVALSLMLRLAEKTLPGDAERSRDLLSRAGDELGDALKELRELARGIHPAILTDHGLGPALEMLAGRASVPVELTTELDGRLPGAVEAAAYYIVAEALTNTAKYARASLVRVHVGRENGMAVVDVSDDGVGGADPTAGSGLGGLGDRIAALGGRLEVTSPPGAGTALVAQLPLRGA